MTSRSLVSLLATGVLLWSTEAVAHAQAGETSAPAAEIPAPNPVPPSPEAPPPPPPVVPAEAPAAVPAQAVPPAGAPSADANLDAEAAKYAADLLNESGGGGGDATKQFTPSLRFYGFADFTIQKWLGLSREWRGVLNDNLSFAISHLNVYAEGDISPNWKSMMEVRFLFQPAGAAKLSLGDAVADPLASTGRTDSSAPDFNDTSRAVQIGGIAIQRAYIEYTVSPYLKVRAGRFLTPWGIWNVDHGSPVIIGPSKPYVIGEQFFPEAQTGFEALGTAPVGDATLGYHLTLSNGRGPADAYEDVDGNKAIGGRLFVRGYWLGQLDIGVSGYGGTVTDRRQQIGDIPTRRVEYVNYAHYREISWAADLKWTWQGLQFQTEAAVHDRAWDDGERPPLPNSDPGAQPDVRRIGVYTLLGYRLPWFNIMPYVIYSYYDAGIRAAFRGSSRVNAFSAGLNVRVTPTVVFKTELLTGRFVSPTEGTLAGSGNVNAWTTQIAWAF